MEEFYRIQHLLNNVSIISKKYDDIAKITGENFNIFSVMSMESNERYTHSAIIGELLNPKGSHRQGSVFLKLFFDEISDFNIIENFDFNNAQIILEEFIGTRANNTEFSGYIDIVVKDKNNVIVIENKIYAGDQYEQLKRYKNYYPNSMLLYLNLFGDLPSKESTIDLEEYKDYQIISYQLTIHNWLQKCYKEAIEQPILRETIKQYLNLIKKLTNQTINDVMSEEIINTMKKSIKESFEVHKNIWNLKLKLYKNFMDSLIDFANSNYMIVNDANVDIEKFYGLYLKPKEWENKPINICVIFANSNFRGLYFGISYDPIISDSEKLFLIEKFKYNGFEGDSFYIWKYVENKDWNDNGEIWEDILKGIESDTYREITKGIKEILEIEKS